MKKKKETPKLVSHAFVYITVTLLVLCGPADVCMYHKAYIGLKLPNFFVAHWLLVVFLNF